MLSEPRLEQRAEQPYMAIRSHVAFAAIPTELPPLLDEVYAWLDSKGIVPAGPPLFRYLAINGEMTQMEVDAAVPVAEAVAYEGRIVGDVLPAGQYAVVMYTGDYGGLAGAHNALLQWGSRNGVDWQQQPDGDGMRWGARVEHYITDPAAEPDSSKWQTEVAFLTA